MGRILEGETRRGGTLQTSSAVRAQHPISQPCAEAGGPVASGRKTWVGNAGHCFFPNPSLRRAPSGATFPRPSEARARGRKGGKCGKYRGSKNSATVIESRLTTVPAMALIYAMNSPASFLTALHVAEKCFGSFRHSLCERCARTSLPSFRAVV
jgi:hypothetical protein